MGLSEKVDTNKNKNNILFVYLTMTDQEQIQYLANEVKNLKEQNSSLMGMFDMTTGYLEKLKKNLEVSEKKLSKANKNLIDSITYAKHIQDAFIVNTAYLQRLIPQSFIFQKPKDIVSGDFVWVAEQNDALFLGVGDCTGHGVPGAMLSIFVVSMLNQIVQQQKNTSPAHILGLLDQLIESNLARYNETIRDSVEVALIAYNKNTKQITFSGAKRPLVVITNGQSTVYKGARVVLGTEERRIEPISQQIIELSPNTSCYLFSDGFADQFGQETDSRFSNKKLLQLLEKIATLPPDKQAEELQNAFVSWKGEKTQTDDVVVVGLSFQ